MVCRHCRYCCRIARNCQVVFPRVGSIAASGCDYSHAVENRTYFIEWLSLMIRLKC